MSGLPSPPAKDGTADIVGRMAGEYRLGRKIGEGGFGAVYEAQHPVLKRRAAVKVLHRVGERDSEAVLRFVAEAQAVNQIRTRHIVDIFSFGKLSDGRHFYVMDLLEGEPLDRFLARVGRLELPLTVQILRPIAEALDTAHAAGIVHRDLKPQNIFLSWDVAGSTIPVLLDFGVAKLLGDSPIQTASGTPIGTPLYMSPEQARGEKVDGRSDVYALGVLCHELLTGEPPIQGDSTIAVLMAHIVEAPPRASQQCSELPPAIDEPILHMLAKQPDARPATASAALGALGEAAERAGIAIPAGLPRLPRPVAARAEEQAGELSHTVAWAEAGALPAAPQEARISTDRPSRSVRRPGLWLFALGALTVLVGYLLFALRAPRQRAAEITHSAAPPAVSPARSSENATRREPPSAPEPASQPSPIEPAAAPAPSRTEPTREPPARRKKRGHSEAIPSDLESPF